MLVVEDILEKMKVHFPRWMDIRRKVNSSSGGAVLESIALETQEINTAIEDYVKDFFIINYVDAPESIISFIYKANVGIVDENTKLIVITDGLDITEDEKEFYEEQSKAFYKDGYLYVSKDYKEGLEIAIDGYRHVVDLEKHHVWNVFDEFAIFLGLKRFQWETNSELLNRILAFSKERVNSTEDGLKHAIVSNLVNIAPDLRPENITIERPTAENLKKYYNEYETVLDYLSRVNRDVYSEKRWGVDVWNFDIKSIDYIPHAWDVVLDSYQNGIGFNEDLEVSIVDSSESTDAVAYFYQKHLESCIAYIQNNNIKESMKLVLKKYEYDLKPETVKYRITASEAEIINPAEIIIKSNENKIGTFKVNVEDVVDPFFFNVEEIDNSILNDAYNYRAEFIPSSPKEDFRIDYCKIENSVGEKINLLEFDRPGFSIVGSEGVKSSWVKKFVQDSYHFSTYENAYKNIDGFMISDLSKPANLSLKINDCSNQMYYIDYKAEEVAMLYKDITLSNCYIKDGMIVADTVAGDKTVTINEVLNSISFEINGPYSLEYSINGDTSIIESSTEQKKHKFKIDKKDTKFKLNLVVNLLNDDGTVTMGNVKYSKYDFIINTAQTGDEVILSEGNLPNFNENELSIYMRSYTGKSPIIKSIYIGKLLTEEDSYDNIFIDTTIGTKFLSKHNGCKIRLTKIDKATGADLEVIENYKPHTSYKAESNSAQLVLMLDNYSEITNISTDVGEIETLSYGGDYVQYVLKLSLGEEVVDINITGKTKFLIKEESLESILNKKGYAAINNMFHVSKNSDEIIAKNSVTGSVEYVTIERLDVLNEYNISSIEIESNQTVMPKFVERGENGNKIETNAESYDAYFDYISFFPINGSIYTAINEVKTVFPHYDGIKMVDTFNNDFEWAQNKCFFKVQSLSDLYEVRYQTGSTFEKSLDKALDVQNICIKRKDLSGMKHNYEEITVDFDYVLDSSIEIPDEIILENNDKIQLNKYIIMNDIDITFTTKLTDIDNQNDYIKSEILFVDNSRFNKLKYSYIDTVDYITVQDNDNRVRLDEDVDYIINKEEGIILWNNYAIKSDSSIEITYSIKKAASFKISLDDLYEKVKYEVNSYKLVDVIKLEKIINGQEIDLHMYPSYKETDKVSIHCSEIGFIVSMDKPGIAKFEQNLKNNTVAVRSGYYYLDGTEHYLFANENYDNIEKINDVYFFNVIKKNKKFYLKQDTTNFITNTALEANTKGEIYDLDCKDRKLKGVSLLNSISACDSFNYWRVFGANLSITDGLNGPAISFKTMHSVNGYCYMDISKFIQEQGTYTLSFYLKGEAKAFLAKERILHSQEHKFNQDSIIDIVSEIPKSELEDNIFNINFNSNEGEYFLVCQGDGVVDDIIISLTEEYLPGVHTKNLDYLNLDIEENIYAEYRTRMFLVDNHGSTFDGTEVKDGDKIVNTSYINWGFTKKAELISYDDFSKCTLQGVDLVVYNNKCIARTGDMPGRIITAPIHIGNVKTINNLLFKINNVMFENMKGFKIKLSTANSIHSSFRTVSQHLDTLGSVNGEKLESYIKLDIEMPENKVINNVEVFLEYSSDEDCAPSGMPTLHGTYTTKVLDGQYTERFIVKNLVVEDYNKEIEDYTMQIRATKNNDEKTMWTEWKTIMLKRNHDDLEDPEIKRTGNILNRIVFDDYRYFQFRSVLKGEDAEIKLKYIEFEVI